jgi:hypothetical protein
MNLEFTIELNNVNYKGPANIDFKNVGKLCCLGSTAFGH